MKNLDVCKVNNSGLNGQIWVFSTFVMSKVKVLDDYRARKAFASDELSP